MEWNGPGRAWNGMGPAGHYKVKRIAKITWSFT
jgi:hypothetical protein